MKILPRWINQIHSSFGHYWRMLCVCSHFQFNYFLLWKSSRFFGPCCSASIRWHGGGWPTRLRARENNDARTYNNSCILTQLFFIIAGESEKKRGFVRATSLRESSSPEGPKFSPFGLFSSPFIPCLREQGELSFFFWRCTCSRASPWSSRILLSRNFDSFSFRIMWRYKNLGIILCKLTNIHGKR